MGMMSRHGSVPGRTHHRPRGLSLWAHGWAQNSGLKARPRGAGRS
ncbi:hypothetical protein HMPREF1979_02539 [Actinomyces johnsonii F0542]|uniref:Uncharacterized protein n=1 Tax=Actinomyces johnsonii F0542 TaxID=1321818 RepID=U1RVK6_9ACTO|nr:hypothetical protein HMPREF1979_02539 [Actinomyces johnsonii F0542]